MNPFVTIMAVFAALGLTDKILGGKLGLADEFDKGLAASGGLALSTVGFYCIGITVGRGINGFLTLRFDDDTLIRAGCVIITAGIAAMGLPLPLPLHMAGLVMVGLGCAPIYPCIIHSTPTNFGRENSQSMVGVQMAAAYVGTTFMPPLFGLIAQYVSISLYPAFLLLFALFTLIMTERLNRLTKK